ncbi:energy-coupling factor ABC transporter permease [Alphaproteobacteria bacterium]|nr:energy-coupling factor ABC transporter permease [Alphaproteobacteria bacterium]
MLRCIFDSSISGGLRLVIFLLSFIMFPIPSFAYGGFIKNGTFSKIMLGLYLLCFVIGIVLGITAIVMDRGGDFEKAMRTYESSIKESTGFNLKDFLSFRKKAEEEVYTGENTYTRDDVQVFDSGRGAQKKERPPPPAPKVKSSSLYEACLGGTELENREENCKCLASGYETNGAVKTTLLGNGPYHRDQVRTVLIAFFDAIRDKDNEYLRQVKTQKDTNIVIGDASKSLGILVRNCKIKPKK